MLRPSKFQINSTDSENVNNSAGLLKPSKFVPNLTAVEEANNSTNCSNPFLRAVNASIDEDSSNNAFGGQATNTIASNNKQNDEKCDENADPLSQITNKFDSFPKSTLCSVKSTISDNSGFVFGQNISERVTGTVENNGDKQDVTSNDGAVASNSCVNDKQDQQGCDGDSGGLLFSSSLAKNQAGTGVDALEKKEVDGQSLLEATRQYEERCKVKKRKYEEVETKTGEEDEKNILDIKCKIFAFVSPTYEERGRGSLRLNDSKANHMKSRVVFRMSGNHRVLVNTKVWQGMTVEKPSPKSLRMTAIDFDGHIKVYLVMARPDDINILYKQLTERVRRAIEHKQILDNEVDDISPSKVKKGDISAENITVIDGNIIVGDSSNTNSETGESEAVVVPISSLSSTISANSNDSEVMSVLGDTDTQSQD